MKNFYALTIILSFLFSMSGRSQTVYEVGADKTYTTVGAAWDAIKASSDTDVEIKVDEGVYIESVNMTGNSNKKITITGSGADKTILKKSTDDTFSYSSAKNPGRLMQLNAGETNLELTMQNIGFQVMGYTNTNGGGLLNINTGAGDGLKITFRNCNFKYIYARVGSIIQILGIQPNQSLVVENCFIEECGTFDNNSIEGIFTVKTGTCAIKNTTFMNNRFNVLNIGNTNTGTDRNLKNGGLISAGEGITGLTIDSCYFVGNQFNGDADKIHPLLSVKPGATASLTTNIRKLVSVGNNRPSYNDCDFYYNISYPPTMHDCRFNAVWNVDDITTPGSNIYTEVFEYEGINIDKSLTYTSPGINLEMDGELPKVYVDPLTGVKHLKTIGGSSISGRLIGKANICQENGKLIVKLETAGNIEVYNVLGKKEAAFLNVTDAIVPLQTGVYIVNTSAGSGKVFIR